MDSPKEKQKSTQGHHHLLESKNQGERNLPTKVIIYNHSHWVFLV
jgi:hypothetical protein